MIDEPESIHDLPEKERTVLVHMVFGSHLYGTNSPESDLDYKVVFIPSYDELLLSRFPRSFTKGPHKEGEDA